MAEFVHQNLPLPFFKVLPILGSLWSAVGFSAINRYMEPWSIHADFVLMHYPCSFQRK